jgi:hypothetical protein
MGREDLRGKEREKEESVERGEIKRKMKKRSQSSFTAAGATTDMHPCKVLGLYL